VFGLDFRGQPFPFLFFARASASSSAEILSPSSFLFVSPSPILNALIPFFCSAETLAEFTPSAADLVRQRSFWFLFIYVFFFFFFLYRELRFWSFFFPPPFPLFPRRFPILFKMLFRVSRHPPPFLSPILSYNARILFLSHDLCFPKYTHL